jgi:hypothetical protein
MASVLTPFTESERYLLQHAFKAMHETHFFQRYVEMRTLEEVAAFDSRTPDEKLLAIERLSAIRSVLLFLAMESKEIAETIELDSVSNDTTGDSDVVEQALFPYLESE